MIYTYIYNATTDTHSYFKFKRYRDRVDFASHRIELAWKQGHRINFVNVARNEIPRGKWVTNSETQLFNAYKLEMA